MSEPAELVLSASSLKSWLGCGYRYYLENVLRLPAPPNMDMAIGTTVHAGAEAHHKGHDPVQATETAFAREYASMGGSVVADPVAAFHDAEMMLAVYREKIAPTFSPTIVEQDFVVRLNGVLMSGRIDAADDNDVRDLKTTGTLSRFRPEFHRLQMSLYAHGFAAITGRKPVRLLLDVVARNLRYKTVEIEPDDGGLADVIAVVVEGIGRGQFDPTGTLNGSCVRCPFAGGICEYAVID